MPPASSHHFDAIVIEDDDLQHVGSQQLEGHHEGYLDLMDGSKGSPTLIEGDPAVQQPDSDPLGADGVCLQFELLWHGQELIVKASDIGMASSWGP